jgi:choline dehydrogenase-like flavoprotein
VIVEEGPLASSSEFRMREREAYPRLYQESAGRQTRDKGITILQGRCVGGSTTVNWTSSFRTPSATLAHWRAAHGLAGLTEAAMAPWFARMEERLSIAPWQVAPNENNDILRRGCEKLGWSSGIIPRNVKGCWNIGYCGMGCPTNAKQSMLVTTIPAALDRGATLLHRARVTRLTIASDRVTLCEARGIAHNGAAALAAAHPHSRAAFRARRRRHRQPRDPHAQPRARPASHPGAPHVLHPSIVSAALMPQKVEGYRGRAAVGLLRPVPRRARRRARRIQARIGGPPIRSSSASRCREFGRGPTPGSHGEPAPPAGGRSRCCATASIRNPPAGRVVLRSDRVGGPRLRDAGLTCGKARGAPTRDRPSCQFAAGARQVRDRCRAAAPVSSWERLREAIDRLDCAASRRAWCSAHVMAGCAMGNDPAPRS